MEVCILQRMQRVRKTSHPWLTEKAVQAVAAKHEAAGTAAESSTAERCSKVLLEEREAHREQTCRKLNGMAKGCKQYWAKSRELLQKKVSATSVPALKSLDGSWVFDSTDKSNLFAETFGSKYALPDKENGVYSEVRDTPVQHRAGPLPDDSVAFEKLRGLDSNSGSGPDLLPAQVLKMCAHVLAAPVAHLARRIIMTSCWPTIWLIHWIVPLFKRNAVFKPANYRGIHLTSQLSKVIERIVQTMYAPFLVATVAFGPNQFAYSPGIGSRDAVAVLVLSWLYGFERHQKFALYCSDVSGAFDKVCCQRLIRKLEAKRLDPIVIRLLASWLQDRSAQVIVGGKHSENLTLKNQVYQGTVLGPGLWNIMYEDARLAIAFWRFIEIVYADDLNAFRAFDISVPNETLFEQASHCQRELHQWGRCNQIAFDPGKESMHVVGRQGAEGSNFKILGLEFDVKLLMHDCVHDTVSNVSWKMQSLMRGRRYFCHSDLIAHYKSQILSFIEYRTPGLYHACSSVLSKLDAVQDRFLLEIGISRCDALFSFNLAPLQTRRDIAMLGVIHRAVLGLGPQQLRKFFVRDLSFERSSTRAGKRRHDKQLTDPRGPRFSEQLRRSALGLVSIYNLLPQGIVDALDVSVFQSRLQALLRDCAIHCEDWPNLFSPRVPLYAHLLG